MKQDNKKRCAFEDCSNLAEVRGGSVIVRKRRKYCSKHHNPESRKKKLMPPINAVTSTTMVINKTVYPWYKKLLLWLGFKIKTDKALVDLGKTLSSKK